MSLFRSRSSNAATDTKLLGYPVSTSVKGRPLPILYGSQRISPQVIWVNGFKAKALGSKLKGGGGKGGAGTQYDYTTSIILAVCQGPILQANTLYVNQIVYSPSNSQEFYIVPGGGGTYTPQFASQMYQDVGVNIPTPYSITVNDFGSPGSATISGTQAIALIATTNPSPGPGEYYVNPTTGSYTFNAAQAGDGVLIEYIWNQSSSTHGATPASAIGFNLILGAIGQLPWTTLTSSYPDQAIGYSETALLTADTFDLGSSGVAPNISIEIYGLQIMGGGILDAPIITPPSIIAAGTAPGLGSIPDLLTAPTYGAGLFLFELYDLTDAGTYCFANSLFASPCLESQEDASSVIKQLLLIANAEGFWSEGVLKFRSYGDTSAVGNGATYSPQTAPVYDLDADDFLCKEGEEPYDMERPTVRDAYNRKTVEWCNRDNNYNKEPLYQDDLWSQSQFGIRADGPIQLHAITTQPVAQQVAIVQVQRSVYIRNKHKFKLPIIYLLLEPMDLITVTIPELGLFTTPVRIISIEETESRDESEFELECEDFPWGTALPTLHPKQVSSTFGPGYFAVPGPTTKPAFVDLPTIAALHIGQSVGIGLCGANQWGGAEVFVSTSGMTGSYTSLGRQNGQATMGVLTTALPYHVDPDGADTLAVNLLESFGELSSYTKVQADNFISLFAVDDELMAYETATLTSAYNYNVTYLRRGLYGSTISAHAIGAPFVVIDINLFNWKYDPSVIGTTVWFKFCSFNQSGQNEQNIANVTAWPHFVEGPRLPYPWDTVYANQPAGINDPLYPESAFSLQQTYNLQEDGFQQSQFLINGYGTVNSFSLISRPPIVTLTQASTGGSIHGGTTIVVGVPTLDANGLQTPMTQQSFTFATGTNTNKLIVNVTFFSAGDQAASVFIALDPEEGWGISTLIVQSISTTATITSLPTNYLNQPPDENNDGYFVQATLDVHGGVWGGIIGPCTSIGGGQCTVQVIGSTWTSNQMAGRIFSLLASQNISAPMELVNCLIVSNTSDTLTLAYDLVGGTQFIFPGDIVEIRTLATTFTSTTIGDANYINGGAGQPGTGLTPNAEVGNLVWIISGTGAGQQRLITANTTTVLTVATTFDVVPDATSIFIVVNPNVQYTTGTSQLPVATLLTTIMMGINVNNIVQNTWVIQVFTVGADGESSLSGFTPFREIFQPGSGGTLLVLGSGSQI